jgi:tetratricopeptide (TPR) repeat protein
MGVIALKSGDTQKALTSFDSARKYDLISLTAYLRGLAHIEAKQGQLAIGDFQGVLEHRGAAFVSRNPIYALAQAGLGRAFASIGDKGNSAKAYQSFLDDWNNADAGQPLVIEAKAHLK